MISYQKFISDLVLCPPVRHPAALPVPARVPAVVAKEGGDGEVQSDSQEGGKVEQGEE